MQTIAGKAVITGTVVLVLASLYAISLGTNIDYFSQVSTGTAGDSMFPTWGPTSDGTTIYNNGSGNVVINGWVVSTLADSAQIPPANSANTQLVRLTTLDFQTPVNTRFVFLNGLADFGTSANFNTPTGWRGMETSGGTSSLQASFHVIGGVSISGYRLFIQQRNTSTGTGDVGPIVFPPGDTSPYAHATNAYHAFKDTISTQGCAANVVTITTSTSNTLSSGNSVWIKDANTNNGVFTLTAATSGSISYSAPGCTPVAPTASGGYVSFVSSGGDAGQCGAIVDNGACLDAGYAGAMIWRGSEAVTMQNIKPVVYGQDGAGTGPDGSSTWCYFVGYNSYQYLHRITCANITGTGWKLASNWTHYNDHGGGCAVTNPANWDALSANATPITGLAINTGQNEGPIVYKGGIYYMLVNLYGGHGGWAVDEIGLYTAPSPCGPWTISAHTPVPGGNYTAMGFPTLLFPFINDISATAFTIPMMADSTINAPVSHDYAGNPVFNLMTIRHP